MWRSYEDYPEDEANKLGLKLDCPALSHSLHYDFDSLDEANVDVGLHRIKISSHKKWISERYDPKYGVPFDWKQHWIHLPFVILERAFTFEELIKINWNSVIQSELSEELRYNPFYRIVNKVENAIYHWCHGKKNYNYLVYWYNTLSKFSFGNIADTEVRFDYSTYYNSYGFSKHTRTFIDGPLSYIIYYKGKHVMTIGFAPSSYGLLINQVQMKNKKGNRWLYKLPCNYFEHVLKCMSKTFNDAPMYLVDGKSLANKVESAYVADQKNLFTDEKRNHIVNTYDRELNQFKRTGKTVSVKGLDFHQLEDLENPNLEWFNKSMNYRPYEEAA